MNERGILVKRYLLFWVVLLLLAFTNGALRELTYKNVIGEPWAHQLSVVTGIVIMGIAIRFAVKRWSFASQRQAVSVGILWVALTEIFEAAMILSGSTNTIEVFISQHNIAAGELWPLFVLWVGVAPVLFYRLRVKKEQSAISLP